MTYFIPISSIFTNPYIICISTISGDIDANIGNVAIEGIVKDSNVIKAKAGAINDGDVSTVYIAKAKGEKAPEIILDLIGIFQLSEIDVIMSDSNTYDEITIFIYII